MIASLYIATLAQQPQPVVHAVATSSYAALRPDELSFSVGDSLILTGPSSEDGWAFGRRHLLHDAATLLLPLGHVRLIPPSEARASSSASTAGAAFSAAIAAANAAAAAAEDDATTADPAVRAAIAAYRRRRAAHNGNAALLEQRWGVRLDLDANPPTSVHHAAAALIRTSILGLFESCFASVRAASSIPSNVSTCCSYSSIRRSS